MFNITHIQNNVQLLDNMLVGAISARNYQNKRTLPTLHSTNVVINDYINCIKGGNYVQLKGLLNDHPNVCDENGLTPLKIAILCNDLNAVTKITNVSKFDNGVIAFACENNFNNSPNVDIIDLLINTNFDVNMPGGSLNEIPLYYAMANDHDLTIANMLLSNDNINLNLPFNNWKSILQFILFQKKYNVLSLFLSNKNLEISKSDLDVLLKDCPIEVVSILLTSLLQTNFSQLVDENQLINFSDYYIKLINRFDISSEILSLLTPHIDINYCDIFGKTPLMYCIESEDVCKLSHVLGHSSIDLTLTDSYGMNALMYAIQKKNYMYIKLLLQKITDDDKRKLIVNQCNKIQETPLLMASKKNDIQLFKAIYESNVADVNCIDTFGYSPLYYSIKLNNDEIFELLIHDNNININIQDLDGLTPLMHLISERNTTGLYKLLKLDSLDVNLTNNDGKNILDFILQKKYNDTPKEIMDKGKDFGMDMSRVASFPECFISSLIIKPESMTSLNDNQNNLINILIQKGTNLNNFDNNDKSLLMYVIDNNDKETFNLLIGSENLDLNAQNSNGQTYLMYLFDLINTPSSFSQCRSSVYTSSIPTSRFDDMMISDNSVIDKPSSRSTKITSTDTNNNVTYFIQLLNHPKTNINATNYLDNTILSLVSATQNINLLTRIVNHKDIDINTQNYMKKTAFMAALLNHLWNNVKLLLLNGANPDIKDNLSKTGYQYLDHKNLFIYNKILKTIKMTPVVMESVSETPESSDQPIINSDMISPVPKGWLF